MNNKLKITLFCLLWISGLCRFLLNAAPLAFNGSSNLGTYSGTASYISNVVTITCIANPAAANILVYPNPPGGGYYMSNNNGQFTYTISGISAGTTLTFYFVIQNPNQWPATETYSWVVSTGSATNPPAGNYGDVNGDDAITIVDALMTAQYSVGLRPQSFNTQAADVNLDGNISIVDALVIAQYYVGWIPRLPLGATTQPTNTPASTRTPAPTITSPAGYTLVWNDEFEGTSVNTGNWVFETGNGSGGWGNNELEYYRSENATVANGELVITAKQESYGGFNYTSARMKTQGRHSWKYGKIEARIKVPLGQGLWPAFWMLGDNISSVNWPACGEIDIMEHINTENTIYGTIHWDNNGHVSYGGNTNTTPANYHIYTIEWDAASIKWFIDGSRYNEADILNNINNTEEFHRNFFILLNLAVGGNWPGSAVDTGKFPAAMNVDYVRVYQKSGSASQPATPSPTATPVPSSGGNWRVVWEDTFEGSGQPSSANWNYNVGNGYNTGSGAFEGWGNGEWEWYRPQNAYLEGGSLVIKAEYNASPASIQGRDWYQFSSRLTTQGKRAWQYGRMEARIALPSAAGTWPAFWMMGTSCDASNTGSYNPAASYYDTMATNWSSCGEVDIMEHRNTESVVTHNLFWDNRTGVYAWQDGSNSYNATENIQAGDVTRFHLYTVEWDSNEIRWYVDRESNPDPTKRVSITASNQEEFHKPFFLMLNLAIQGRFTGPADPNENDFPLYMKVDYVRVWQQN